MGYEEEKVRLGHEPVYVVEMDLDFCSLAFSVGLCSATPDPSNECFNTFATCPVKADYSAFGRSTKTYRFTSKRIDELQGAGDAITFPTIKSISMAPSKLSPGQGLGVRATVNIQLDDHPWTDESTDPYLSGRNYDPDEQGTFWGKFLARNKFYENREIRILQGYLNEDGSYDPANMVTRSYVIHQITGPNSSGKVNISGKDPLKFADAVKAQWPRVSQAALSADMNDTQLTFTFYESSAGIFNGFSGGQKYVRIDDEILLINSIVDNGSSNYTATVLARGTGLPATYTKPTEADEHKDDTNIQLCHYFNNIRIDDLVYFLLNTAAEIDASFLPLSLWANELSVAGLGSYIFECILAQPESVKTLLQELTEYTIILWWHERQQKILMGSLIDRSSGARPVYNETDNLVKNSVNVTKDVKGRISQVWLLFGLRNPLEDIGKQKSFSNIEIAADLSKEGDDSYGKSAVRQIFSRWIPRNNRALAISINTILLKNYKDVKTVLTTKFDPKDDAQWTGDRLVISSKANQDAFGANKNEGFIILETKEALKSTGTEFTYLLQAEEGIVGNFARIAPDSLTSELFSTTTQDIKNRYIFIAPDSGIFADGSPAYQIDF